MKTSHGNIHKRVMVIASIIALGVILAFLIECVTANNWETIKNCISSEEAIQQETTFSPENLKTSGYNIEGTNYYSTTDDPQMASVGSVQQFIKSVTVHFAHSLDEEINITVYYDDGGGLSEEHSVSVEAPSGAMDCRLELGVYADELRFDIGNQAGQSFDLDSIVLNEPAAFSFHMIRAMATFILIDGLAFLCLLLFWHVQDKGILLKLKQYKFLFSELVKRDFTLKYKRTMLGMLWSILNPLLTLLIMWLVFNTFFGWNTDHYVIYLFAGNLVFSFFNESTGTGMTSLLDNAGIFTKINVPKYLFLFSKNVSALINFGLTFIIFFIFCLFDNIIFTWKFIFLLYPICCLIIFNLGVGLFLSAAYVFFRDMQYLWGVFTTLLMYLSAIFYTIDSYSNTVQCMFLLNPVYVYIRYVRKIVIDSTIPTVWFHLIAAGYAIIVFGIGCYMYKRYNHEFLYYV